MDGSTHIDSASRNRSTTGAATLRAASDEIVPVDLAPASAVDPVTTFHAELCNDGTWGVCQTTRWQYREHDEWDCRGGLAWDQEACDLAYGLSKAEAVLIAARLQAVAR